MKNTGLSKSIIYLLCLFLLYVSMGESAAQSVKHGTLLTQKLTSTVLRENRIDLGSCQFIQRYVCPAPGCHRNRLFALGLA